MDVRIESYTLEDFSKQGWMDRPEYCTYDGISIKHIRNLHGAEKEEFVGKDFVAFLVMRTKVSWVIHIYEINSWNHKNEIRSVHPSFRVFGTTFDGIREVQACADVSPMPWVIVEQMNFVEKLVCDRGWKE